jgi:demethylmenaquinone methyltransferase/2-methoxy-6-polyprenyl-1,4-benzoquinol methylase
VHRYGRSALAAIGESPGARRVIGIDFSAAMLKIGQDKVRPTGAIGLIRGDASQIPLGDASVDAVTIGFGIRNVAQPALACREIVRVLRPGGTLVILEFSLPRSTILRNLYLWYFRQILPLVGRLVSKHPSAYTYLPESVASFPLPAEFVEQLRTAGFGTVRATPVTFGIVWMFVAVKDSARHRVI